MSQTTAATTVKEKPEKVEKEKKKKQTFLMLCTPKLRYVVVKKACRQLGFKMMDDETGDWDMMFYDTGGITPE
jgi:hypothetical protein